VKCIRPDPTTKKTDPYPWLGVALAVGLAVALGLPGVATAKQSPRYGYVDVVTVVAVDPDAERITVRDGWRQRELVADEDTRVNDALGQPMALAALEPWDRVAVDARREMEGDRQGEIPVVDRIQLVIGTPGSDRRDAHHVRDAEVRGRVVERLAASRSLQGSTVWVTVADGQVVLRGLVADDRAAQRAIELARRTPGVRGVRSELRTEPTLAEWLRTEVTDEVLAREVAERIAAEAFPNARSSEDWIFGWEIDGRNFELDVDADMGTVTLSGSVPSAEDAERALSVARRTPGVRSVRMDVDTR
jgi:osmotically-inducible protein OsmY